MSHFAILVLMKEDQDLATLLAPYSENLECEPRISSTREEFITNTRKYYKDNPDIFNLSDDDFIEKMRENDYRLDEKGNELTVYNPKSQWDWWSVGGRWSDILRLTDEGLKREESEGDVVYSATGVRAGFCNAAKMKYLDFTPSDEDYAKNLRRWELCVENQEPTTEKEEDIKKWNRYKPEYYTERYGTKENYVKITSMFGTWAVVTPDGNWHQKGNMGWFACSDETDEEAVKWESGFQERFLDTADPEWIAVVVDCHI